MSQARALLILALVLSCMPAAAEGDPAAVEGEPAAWQAPASNAAALKAAPALPEAARSEARARAFVEALRRGDPEAALPFFFPQDAFRRLKTIKEPDRYFSRLTKVYKEDVAAMRKTLKHPDEVEFVSFELGRQRSWIEVGKEGNAFPYWAVYKSILTVKDGQRLVPLQMRVMIHWGDQWYVTHLTNK